METATRTEHWTGRPAQSTNIVTYGFLILVTGAILAHGGSLAVIGAAVLATDISSSQVQAIQLALLATPLGYFVWTFLVTHFTRYSINEDTIRKRTGVFNVKVDYIELYRIKDHQIHRPLLQRLFHVGTIRIYTSDKSKPEIHFVGISHSEELADLLRDLVEKKRRERGVRELDVSGG